MYKNKVTIGDIKQKMCCIELEEFEDLGKGVLRKLLPPKGKKTNAERIAVYGERDNSSIWIANVGKFNRFTKKKFLWDNENLPIEERVLLGVYLYEECPTYKKYKEEFEEILQKEKEKLNSLPVRKTLAELKEPKETKGTKFKKARNKFHNKLIETNDFIINWEEFILIKNYIFNYIGKNYSNNYLEIDILNKNDVRVAIK